MGWRDQLRPASFRGVGFRVMELTREGGVPAWVLHDYPFKDVPYAEEMGRTPTEFSIDAYVIGSDWIAQRDTLEAACWASGSATLVLPTRGERVAVCTKCSVREATSREGGIARFSLGFTLADAAPSQPAATPDTSAKVASAADLAAESAKSDFADKWLVDGDGSLATDGASLLDNLGTSIDGAFSGPLAVLSAAEARVNAVAIFRAQALALTRTPNSLAARVMDLIFSASLLTTAPSLSLPRWRTSTLAALVRVAGWAAGLDPVPGSGTVARQAAVNQDALGVLVAQSAAIAAARTAAETDFEAYDDAAAARTLVAAQLDTARNLAATDASFQALTALRTASVRDITDRGSQLSRLSRVRLGATLPVEVVAYRLLGDADRADEILARNPVRHPGFVPGGSELEVLGG